MIPPAVRTESGYRIYNESHLAALLTTRAVVAGFGWQAGMRAIQHLNAGAPERAFAVADRAHLELHEARRHVLATIATLGTVVATDIAPRSRRPVRIGEAASRVGVEVSAVRHWEREGLLAPRRDPANGYRFYSDVQVRQLHLIAQLRAGGYPLSLIRSVVEELTSGDVAAAVAAAEKRLAEINTASQKCAAATAALWSQFEQSRLDCPNSSA